MISSLPRKTLRKPTAIPSFNDDDLAANYDRLGALVPPPPPTVSLEELRLQYPDAFTQVSEGALQSVLDELQLPFDLSPFQIFAISDFSIYNRRNNFYNEGILKTI